MSLDQLLATLRDDYIAQIPQKIEIIDAQIAAAKHDDLRESFHKLKGTGKTYGVPEITEVAELVESLFLHASRANALLAAKTGVELLKEIHQSRQAGNEHPVALDPRLLSLRKLLPS